MIGAKTQVDLQIESKLLSVSTGLFLCTAGGRAKNQYSEPSKRDLGTVHTLAVRV